jgi:hypothetical protein
MHVLAFEENHGHTSESERFCLKVLYDFLGEISEFQQITLRKNVCNKTND